MSNSFFNSALSSSISDFFGDAVGITVPDVAVPDVSGQAAYPTNMEPAQFDTLTGEGLDDTERSIYLAWMAAGTYISGGAWAGMVDGFLDGIRFVWDNIIPDDWKAHGKRDYLYSTVAEALLMGDATYRTEKSKMLKAGVPAWRAFPTTGLMGTCEIVDLTYWTLQITWNSVLSKLRRSLNQLDQSVPNNLTFGSRWHAALKNHGFFTSRMWNDSLMRGFSLGHEEENFKVGWHTWTDDPDQEDIEYFATQLSAFINDNRIRDLRNAAKEIIDFLSYLKKEDAREFLPVIILDDDYWQENWRWCKHCRGLFFAGHNDGVCPTNGRGHDKSGSGNYSLNYNEPKAPDQHNWRWCKKCQGLYFAGRNRNVCPAGGAHDGSSSGDYIMHERIDGWNVKSQLNWRWCKKCQGLYHLHRTDNGHCPAGGDHDGSGSRHYVLRVVSDDDEKPPIIY